MDHEMDNHNWNDDYQNQDHQPNPCEQPDVSFASQNQWMQKSWLNIKVSTWLKCLIIIAVLTAAAFIAPKSTPADNQQQNSSSLEAEDNWYYEDFLDDYGCEDYDHEEDYGYEEGYNYKF